MSLVKRRARRRAAAGSLPRRRRRSSSTSRCAATRWSGTRSPSSGASPTAATTLDAGRMADLEDQIAAHDGYTLEARAGRGARGARHPHRGPPRAAGTLSGGFKLRVLLAQVLVGGADVLLLDEPTNHLDILSIRWLEKFLADYAGCAVIISHDQRFLDNVASHTLDVDYGTITLYTGNYSTFDGREGGGARPQGDGGRARRGRDRAQARLRRALRRQGHQGHARRRAASSRSRDRGRGAGGELAPRARRCASSPSARAAATCWSWPASASRTATSTC